MGKALASTAHRLGALTSSLRMPHLRQKVELSEKIFPQAQAAWEAVRTADKDEESSLRAPHFRQKEKPSTSDSPHMHTALDPGKSYSDSNGSSWGGGLKADP